MENHMEDRIETKNNRIDSIDALKGIACCIIAFLWHYLNLLTIHTDAPLYGVFSYFYRYGLYMVEFFFMLSGFGIAYSYRQKIQRENGISFVDYMSKRYRRLYPLFFITLMVTTILQELYNSITGSFYQYRCDAFTFILNLLCIQNESFSKAQSFNGPAWFLGILIILYVLYYFSTYVSRKSDTAYWLINLAFFSFGIMWFYNLPQDFWLMNPSMARGISGFYGGVLLASVYNQLGEHQRQQLAIKALISAVLFRLYTHFSHYSFWDDAKQGWVMLVLFEFPILIFAAISIKTIKKILAIKPLLLLGAVSMEIYLLHIPVQIIIKSFDAAFRWNLNYSSTIIWVIYIVAVFILALLTHRLNYSRVKLFKIGMIGFACLIAVPYIAEVAGIKQICIYEASMEYSDSNTITELTEGQMISERFKTRCAAEVESISFYAITWNKPFRSEQVLYIDILDSESHDILFHIEKPMRDIDDGKICTVSLDEPVYLKKGSEYELRFSSNTIQGDESMALMLANDTRTDSYCTYKGIEGIAQGEHISAVIVTRKKTVF